MAIYQSQGWPLGIVGDGVSTTMVIDMYDYIKQTNILPKTPSAILDLSVTAGPAVTGTLSGSILTLTFASPLAFASWTLNVELGF